MSPTSNAGALVPILPHARVPGHGHQYVRKIFYRPLARALTVAWPTDAHFQACSSPALPHRLTGACLGKFPIRIVAFVVDIDSAWDPAKVFHLDAAHPGGAYYQTRGGWRVVFREDFPIANESDAKLWSEQYILRLGYLARAFGIVADPKCRDWTRIFRLPFVVRDGVPQQYLTHGPEPDHALANGDLGDPRNVAHWDYDPTDDETKLDEDEVVRLASASRAWSEALHALQHNPGGTRTPGPRAPTRPLDDVTLERIARRIAAEVTFITDERHDLYRALACSLLDRGIEGKKTVKLIGRIARLSCDSKARARVHDAETTVERWQRKRRVIGYGTLRRQWEEVADAVDEVLPRDETEKPIKADLAETVPSQGDATTARREIARWATDAVRTDGAKVLAAPLGIGKTTALAAALAWRDHGGIYSADTHRKIGEIRDQVKGVNTGIVQIRRGVRAVTNVDADGHPNCLRADEADEVLLHGGRVTKILCPTCEYRNGCAARLPVGKAGGVVVVPHQLAYRQSYNKPTLPLVLDDPGDLIEILEFSKSDWIMREEAMPEYGRDPKERAKFDKLMRAAERERLGHSAVEEYAGGRRVRVAILSETGMAFRAAANAIVASATPCLDELRKLRPDLTVKHVDAAPAVPPVRTILEWGQAAKGRMMPKRKVAWELVTNAVLHALERARAAGVRRLLLVTHKPIAAALIAGKLPKEAQDLEGQMDAFKAEGRELAIGWYGALRGVNTYEHWDGCATIGDPWPNKAAVFLGLRALGITGSESGKIWRQRTRAELAQVHGRLRDMNRTIPAWHLHIGSVAPLDWDIGSTLPPEPMPTGRPQAATTRLQTNEEIQTKAQDVGSIQALARTLGVSRWTIWRRLRCCKTPHRDPNPGSSPMGGFATSCVQSVPPRFSYENKELRDAVAATRVPRLCVVQGGRGDPAMSRQYCECGMLKDLAAPACPRCLRLDGDNLPVAAAAVLAELRVLGASTIAALHAALPGYSERTVYRALAVLAKINRVHRRMEPVAAPPPVERHGWQAGFDARMRRVPSRWDDRGVRARAEEIHWVALWEPADVRRHG